MDKRINMSDFESIESEQSKFDHSDEGKILTLQFEVRNLKRLTRDLQEEVKSIKKESEIRIRKLEDWKVAMYAYGFVLGLAFTFLSKYLKTL